MYKRQVFGLICGLLLSHCTIEIIYHFDFRKLFSSRISMAVCGLCAALVFFGFQFDLFGYDKYIPKPESLESVAVSLNNMEYWVDYGSAKLDDGSYYWDYELSLIHICGTGSVVKKGGDLRTGGGKRK